MDSSTYIYDEEIRPVDRIEFSVLGNEEVLRMSALDKDGVGIDIPDLYDNMEPKPGGLIDTRMGTSDNNIDCTTCGLGLTDCIGHFGHIVLAKHVYHMGYLKYVKNILSCICLKCSKLLIHKNEEEIADMLKHRTPKERFNEIKNAVKNVSVCQRPGYSCGAPVTKIKIDEKKKSSGIINITSETIVTGPVGTDGEGSKKLVIIITPEIAYHIFSNISDIDCKIMGIDPYKCRPEMLIIKILSVPPVSIRPSTKADFTSSGLKEDDLVHHLANIVKANVRIRKYAESSDTDNKYTVDQFNLLQFNTASYYDNEQMPMARAEQRGRAAQSLAQRLKRKGGRFRANLMGKRVNFSSRTVITPDPSLDINQLGVPIKIAMNLTFPEVVTPYNIDQMQNLVRNGRYNYPGANFVFPLSQYDQQGKISIIDLRYRKEEVVLKYGDIVERHLVDGDYVLLNRQPTLHKLSMMGHKIKVINNTDYSTFRLSVYTTAPYNADFDGDEMNIFIPQSIQSFIELAEIADVKRQIISPRTSAPVIGAVQDGLLGAYNLTDPSIKIDWRDAMNIISYTSIEDFSVVKKNKTYKGIEIASLIIPGNIYYSKGKSKIVDGEIESGRLTNSQLGPRPNGLIHLIWDEYGMDRTNTFIADVAKLFNNFNLYNGFTVGMADTTIPDELIEQINTVCEEKKLEVLHMITEFENNPDMMDGELFEVSVSNLLNTVLGNISELCMKNLKPDNNFGIQIVSGAKGKETNMGQMSGCLGQQLVEGSRILKKLNNRSLPYYHQHDDSAEARGFIKTPFVRGLNVEEFICHNMTGREGLISTSIKTSETGYLQRKMIKRSEDVMIDNDGTVRTGNKIMLQPVYGDSGVDSTKQYGHKLQILLDGDKELNKKYSWTPEQLKSLGFNQKEFDEYFKDLVLLRNTIRQTRIQLSYDNKVFNSDVLLPVSITQIIDNISNSKLQGDKLTMTHVLEKLRSIIDYENTQILCMSKNDSDNINSIKYKDELLCKTMFKLALYQFLSPKIAIEELKLNKTKFDNICNAIIKKFNSSIVEPGEMVGMLSAQSICEPLTQMSVVRESYIVVTGDKPYSGPIGKFIDKLIEENEDSVVEIDEDSVVLDITDNYQIIGVSNDEKISWNKILQVSRHPCNGGLVKIITESGKTTTATKSHSFLKKGPNGIIPALGSELVIGDFVPVAKQIFAPNDKLDKIKILYMNVNLDREFGLFCGWFVNCGKIYANRIIFENNNTINYENYQDIIENLSTKLDYNSSDYGKYLPGYHISINNKSLSYWMRKNFKKKLPEFMFTSNMEFINAFFQGLATSFQYNNISEHTKMGIELLKSYSDYKPIDNNVKLINVVKYLENSLRMNIDYPDGELKLTDLDKYIPMFEQKHNTLSNLHNVSKETINKLENFESWENDDLVRFISNLVYSSSIEYGCPRANYLYSKYKSENITKPKLDNYIKSLKSHIQRFCIKYNKDLINDKINTLKYINTNHIHWDKIVDIIELEDNEDYVYDFTVPGNDSFMVDAGILVHNTLNTFHHAGIGVVSTMNIGADRIKELLAFSKNIKTPVMTIYLEDKYRKNKQVAEKVASYLEYTTIKDLRDFDKVIYDPNPNAENSIMKQDNVYNIFYGSDKNSSCIKEYYKLPWLIRLTLNKNKMMERNITLLDIKSKFCNYWENRYTNKNIKREEKRVLDIITECSILSNSDNDKDPVIHIRFDMTEYSLNNINSFLNIFIDNFRLKGYNDIQSILSVDKQSMVTIGEDNEISYSDQYAIYTKGVNINALQYINGIDMNKIFTNDVVAIYKKYGIEAARNALFKEFSYVFQLDGSFINTQHLSILTDIMTVKGSLVSVDRHGLKMFDSDPLAKASFEKTVDVLLEAAMFSEIDQMNSVSSRICAGLVIEGGTGLCNIKLDTEMIENSEYIDTEQDKYKKTFTELDSNAIIDDMNEVDESDIFIPM